MTKIIIIILLVGLLLFFLTRRLMNIRLFKPKHIGIDGFYLIDTDANAINRIMKSTFFTVFIGFVLLVIIVILALKVKIILILLPISFYLIFQIFLLNNHIKATRDQKIWFNSKLLDVIVDYNDGNRLYFNIIKDIKEVNEINSIQKNRGVLLGFFDLDTQAGHVVIPFLLRENPRNKVFFEAIFHYHKTRHISKLYPSI